MFLQNSRYYRVETVEATRGAGATVTALKLRRLPSPGGVPYVVKDQDRGDLKGHEMYGDATKFWHIADANTALDAEDLFAETRGTIYVPET